MPNQFSPFPSHKDTGTAARNQPSKLTSWLTSLRSRNSVSPSPPSLLPLPQSHSPLLSALPLEIRREIYIHVLCYYGIAQHIFLSNDKLTHMRCTSSHIYFQEDRVTTGLCKTYDAAYRNSVRNGWEIIALLLSCRQVHLEFSQIIYSTITFHIHTHFATPFITAVPAPYLALAHLHLSFSVYEPMYLPHSDWPVGFKTADTNPKAEEATWEAFWRVFARFHVRILDVEIHDQGVRVPEELLLKPLRKVRAGRFEVILPWPVGLETSGEFRDASFVVKRPPAGTDLMVNLDVDRGYTGLVNRRGIWARFKSR